MVLNTDPPPQVSPPKQDENLLRVGVSWAWGREEVTPAQLRLDAGGTPPSWPTAPTETLSRDKLGEVPEMMLRGAESRPHPARPSARHRRNEPPTPLHAAAKGTGTRVGGGAAEGSGGRRAGCALGRRRVLPLGGPAGRYVPGRTARGPGRRRGGGMGGTHGADWRSGPARTWRGGGRCSAPARPASPPSPARPLRPYSGGGGGGGTRPAAARAGRARRGGPRGGRDENGTDGGAGSSQAAATGSGRSPRSGGSAHPRAAALGPTRGGSREHGVTAGLGSAPAAGHAWAQPAPSVGRGVPRWRVWSGRAGAAAGGVSGARGPAFR